MHGSWVPIARWTSAAATAESTPPERPQITFDEPAAARISRRCASTHVPGVQHGSAWYTPKRKLEMIQPTAGVCDTSGQNSTDLITLALGPGAAMRHAHVEAGTA